MTQAEQDSAVDAITNKVRAVAVAKIRAVRPPLDDAQCDAVELIIADALSAWADGIVEIANQS